MDRQVLLALGAILATPVGEDPQKSVEAAVGDSLTPEQKAQVKEQVAALRDIVQGANDTRERYAKSLDDPLILPSEPTPEEEEEEDEPAEPDPKKALVA